MNAESEAPRALRAGPPVTREIRLAPGQREEFEPLMGAVAAAQRNLNAALKLIGVDPARLVGYSDGVLTVTEPPEREE